MVKINDLNVHVGATEPPTIDRSSTSRKEHIQVARNNTIAGIESIQILIILIAAASYC